MNESPKSTVCHCGQLRRADYPTDWNQRLNGMTRLFGLELTQCGTSNIEREKLTMDVKTTELQKKFLDCVRSGGIDRWQKLYQAMQESPAGASCMLAAWQYQPQHHDMLSALAAALSAKPDTA